MHILVVENEGSLAHRLAEETRRSGDEVIGPFADLQDAMNHVDSAHAAILDIKLGAQTSFPIADVLSDSNRPFLFLTGYERYDIPSRFDQNRVHSKSSPAQSLLSALHSQYHRKVPKLNELQDIIIDMLAYAWLKTRDKQTAERLVEAAMTTAIRKIEAGEIADDFRATFIGLLEYEARDFKGRYLQ